ncbi:hypothetical protein D3C77_424700 [compost metagenome]
MTLKELKYPLLDGAAASFTMMVYVFVVTPSCAVTTIVMSVEPSASSVTGVAWPLARAVLFTVTVAVESCKIAVTITDDVPYGTTTV